MKKWFNQIPFTGWLLLALLFAAGTFFRYQLEKEQLNPVNLAKSVQSDFLRRETSLNKAFRQRLFNLPLDEDKAEALRNNFCIILYKNNQPIFWNSNAIPTLNGFQSNNPALRKGVMIRLGAGVYYAQRFETSDTAQYFLTFIPIAYQYKHIHQYFRSYFLANKKIPPDATLGQIGYVIKKADGQTAFHIAFPPDTHSQFKISGWVGLLTLLTLAFGFLWVHKICVEIGRRTKPVVGWLVLFLLLACLNLLRDKIGYPSGYVNAGFFSPKILASGADIRSFPDLCFYVLFDTWLILYFIREIPVKSLFSFNSKTLDKTVKLLVATALLLELFYGQAGYMHMLIIDSKIPFVVNDVQDLSIYSFLGIGLMCLITLNFIFIISIIDRFLKQVASPLWARYLLFAGIGFLCIFGLYHQELTVFNLTLLLLSVIGLALIQKFGLPVVDREHKQDKFITSKNYVWFLILCTWVVVEIFYFSFAKEKAIREIFAARIEQQDDAILFYSFNKTSEELQRDKLLKAFLEKPSEETAQTVGKYIAYHYLGGNFLKYQPAFYYFDSLQKPLFGQDALGSILLQRADSISKTKMTNGFVSLKNPLGKNMYWGMVPVSDSAKKKMLGYIGIDFSFYKSPRKSPTAMILQPESNSSDEQLFSNYSYAIYRNNRIEAQFGNHSFPYRSYFNANRQSITFRDYWDSSDLFYKPSANELIIVQYKRNIGANIISLYSYVLAVWLILFGVFFLINFLLSTRKNQKVVRKNFNLSIRAKVNWAILLTVFLSLLVVGSITIVFLRTRYQASQRQMLGNLMFFYRQSVIHFIETNKQDALLNKKQGEDHYMPVTLLLNSLTSEQGVDINLYDSTGVLITTSQGLLFQNGYLAPLMNPEALFHLNDGLQSDWVTEETLGQLHYQSFYLPIRNKDDKIIAYLNIPYYSSQGNLKSEVSGILTTLINIYMLIFFIAGILALLISNSIVRSFYLLIDQFKRIRLEKNALIRWPYRDELSLLVVEYNKMILKVEKMAVQLANSQREAAWREVALQIAHEIKNPLTPMKLNVQFLLKAMKGGHKEVFSMVENISASLIEQIENLNIIASEFAHFARMPEAHPEIVEVTEQLNSLVQLHRKGTADIHLITPEEMLKVWMDKSYFIRIFTNLLKNAMQAIPQSKDGLIEISVEEIPGQKLKIGIKDNGNGIPDSVKGKIFTPYFTTKSSGTGIGLAMTKKMVELSGGQISFETQAGRGTRFTVIFPLYSD